MVDAWEVVAVADESQLRDDLAEECRTAGSDFAVIERMVKAALVGSLVGETPNARAGDRGRNPAGIVIPFRPSRSGP
jgi:hypothetical protein